VLTRLTHTLGLGLAVVWVFAANASEGVLVADFRHPSPVHTEINLIPAEQDELVLSGSAISLLGELNGSFTAVGTQEQLYLVRPQTDGTALPAAPSLRDGLSPDAQNWRLPEPYPTALEKAIDLDGDGIQEIVLRSDSYQMGTSAIRIGVLSLVGGRLRELLPLTEMYLNTCASPFGEKSITTGTLHWRVDSDPSKRWIVETFKSDCPHSTDSEVAPLEPQHQSTANNNASDALPLTGHDYNVAALQAETQLHEHAEQAIRVDFYRKQAYRGQLGGRVWQALSLTWRPNDGSGPAHCVLAVGNVEKSHIFDVLESAKEDHTAWSCDGEPTLRLVDLDNDLCPEVISLTPMRLPSGERILWPTVLHCSSSNLEWTIDSERTQQLKTSLDKRRQLSLHDAETLLRSFQPSH
jgi:hypothetical protein